MKISVDISYYPLKEDFKPAIRAFIGRLSEYSDLKVNPGSISTQVFGEFDEVMSAITTEMKKAFEVPSSVFVLKILNSDRNKPYIAK